MGAGETPRYPPLVPPSPFSMETRKRRRRRVCYGKVSPWSETVSGVSAGSELPLPGEEAREGGRSLATYIYILSLFFFPGLIIFYSSSTYLHPSSLLPPPSPGLSAEMRLCALIPSRALKQNPAPRRRQRLGAPRH